MLLLPSPPDLPTLTQCESCPSHRGYPLIWHIAPHQGKPWPAAPPGEFGCTHHSTPPAQPSPHAQLLQQWWGSGTAHKALVSPQTNTLWALNFFLKALLRGPLITHCNSLVKALGFVVGQCSKGRYHWDHSSSPGKSQAKSKASTPRKNSGRVAISKLPCISLPFWLVSEQ